MADMSLTVVKEAADPWTLHHGDAIRVLERLPTASVDAVVTDPPYSSGGLFRGDRSADPRVKYASKDSALAASTPSFMGDSRDQLSWLKWCACWLVECFRVTRDGGILAMFCDWRQLAAAIEAMQLGGWVYRGCLAWVKPASRPQQGRYRQQCEFIPWGTRGHRPIEGECYDGVVTCHPPPPSAREHLTQKPVEVVEFVLGPVTPGGVVLDPFMGSGTTGVACVRTGRRFVGIDCDPVWMEVAARRMREEAPLFTEALHG